MSVASRRGKAANRAGRETRPVNLCDQPTHVLAQRLRRGELRAVEVLEAHLERIARHNGTLNAVVSLDVDGARKAAKAADAAFRRGKIRGPLHGVPMTLKDGLDVAGLRTTIGSSQFDRVATEDSAVAARLRAAGAIIIGHTNVPPMLADYQSANPIFGRTNNPWDSARTAGGSSGGAAAAVAAGMTPLEIGSDLAGSLRLPAHFCGVYGLKTTEHRVPITGFFRPPGDGPQSVRIMLALGPMARDLRDLEIALRLVAGPDGLDVEAPPVPLAPTRRGRVELEGLRVVAAPALPGMTVARSIRQRVEAVSAAAADAGVKIDDELPDVDWDLLRSLFIDVVMAITGIFDPGATLRDEQRSLAWYLDALARRDRFAATLDRFFERVDALILPAAMSTAFTHRETGAPIEVDGTPVNYWALGEALVFCNLTGLPSLVVPAGADNEGLPIGIQIIGPRWSELRLLDIARALERARILPGFRSPPLDG